MKKIFLFTISLLLFISMHTVAQENYEIIENNYQTIKLRITPDELKTQEVKTEKGYFTRIMMDNYQNTKVVGAPELPILIKMLEIPLCDEVHINVTGSEYVIYDGENFGINHPIFPAQPSYLKTHEGPIDLIQNDELYLTDQFFSVEKAKIEKVGIMRNINLATLYVSPIEYNPVTNEIKVYEYLDVEITFENADVPATCQMKNLHGNGVFMGAASQVINPIAYTDRDVISSAPIKYLIIAHSMFRNDSSLEEFIAWKKRIGYIVQVGYTDDSNVGTTTTSIKSFIQSQYTNATTENPAPTYLLLIGDAAQIPPFAGNAESHVTDLYYSCLTTGDNIPDLYYGRFSAQNVAQLEPQIAKTLMVEQYEMPDPTYLDKAVLVAGSDSYWSPTHANGQMNYLSNNYINTAYGYSTVNLHLYNSSSQAATIRNEIGQGVGYANYTAHCGPSGWSDPTFETSHVSAMSNANKYGLMIGNCCQSGMFAQSSDCFGEALLRAANKGAMAYIGASNNTYWDEDFYWAVGVRSSINANPTYSSSNLGAYDKLFHTHNEPYSSWFTSNGALLMGGNLSIQSSSSTAKLYYWEIYHLFGDPSIMTPLTQSEVMTVSTNSAITTGTSSLQVTAVPYAYVALTYNNTLIGAAFADGSGLATLNFDALSTPGEYELAVTAQKYQPYFTPIMVIIPSGSYVLATQANLSSSSIAQFGSTILWNITLENLGVESASNVYAKLTCNDANIIISQDSVYAGTLNANANIQLNNSFTAQIPNNIIDGTSAIFTVTTYFGNNSSTKNISLIIKAPTLSVETYSVSDATSGNNDGIVDPGETVTLTITNKNSGHATATNLNTFVSSYYAGISFASTSQNIASIDANGTEMSTFTATIANSVPEGTLIPVYYTCASGAYVAVETLYVAVGNVMEDFESNSFTEFGWTNASTNPWIIASSGAYAGTYCARSKQNLANGASSILQITITSAYDDEISFYRKVSSEQSYDFFSFYIDGVKQAEESGTISWGLVSYPVSAGTHTFKFEYSKDYSQASGSDCAWIDNITFPAFGTIAAIEGAFLNISNFSIEDVSNNFIPYQVNPTITFNYTNIGTETANNVVTRLESDNSNLLINGMNAPAENTIPSILVNESLSSSYTLHLPDNTPGHNVDVNLFFSLNSSGQNVTYPVALTFEFPLSIEDANNYNVSIYPNPATNYIVIGSDITMTKIEIIDLIGKTISTIDNLGASNKEIGIEHLSQGAYFVRITNQEGEVAITRFIKQ